MSDLMIADRLAEINYETHQAVPETVGPRCIVVWRRQPDARPRQSRGSGHQAYTGTDRDRNSDALPTIANGLDVRSIANVLIGEFMGQLTEDGKRVRDLEIDPVKINQLLAQLPSEPDERLR
ncbi:hypothetical protein [Nonomuraea typhae]|uniref:hypothetical protein n=1 Tax=Nonomuraea typhae TaxID=2603600 RepID=UPI0012FC97A5|nr:hypothetical protein [Nonomuraea typhae]